MGNLVTESNFQNRKHRAHLGRLLSSTSGIIRIASAYVTESSLVSALSGRERRLLVSLLPMDVASGATSIEALKKLITSGVVCKKPAEGMRLHAKVYIAGDEKAVVTSANLTTSAFDKNIEAGVEVDGEQVADLIKWFDLLWNAGKTVTLNDLTELHRETAALRSEFLRLRKKERALRVSGPSVSLNDGIPDSIRGLFSSAERYFVCNSDRRQGERSATGGYVLEEIMLSRGYATAWETFLHPSHMQKVQAGDAVFLFAKKVGIIAVGTALGGCETRKPNAPDRVGAFPEEKSAIEWRVPVQWLLTKEDVAAYRYKAPNMTFWDISAPKYAQLRENVKKHFAGSE